MTTEELKKIQAFKDQWAAAKTKGDQAGMAAANQGAEAIRANYGFSGGKDGSQFIEIAKPPTEVKPPDTLPAATDNRSLINSMYDSTAAAQTAALNAARDQANSDYQAQIDATPGQFVNPKNEVDVNTLRSIQAMNESAAAKNQTFSGGVQSDMGAAYSAGAGAKAALSAQEQTVLAGLRKAIADNTRATSFKQIEMTAQNQAQRQGALLGEQTRLDEANYRRATDQFNQGLNLAGLTGYYGGQRTLQGQQFDTGKQQWQQSFDQGVKESDRQFAFQENQAAIQQENWIKTFDWNKDRAKVQDGQWLKAFQADQKNAAAGRAIQWAGLQLDRDKFNEAKKQASASTEDQSKEYQNALKGAYDMITLTKKGVDASGVVVDLQVNDEKAVFNYIYNNPYLNDDQKLALAKQLGLAPTSTKQPQK